MLETQLPSDDCNFWHELAWSVSTPFIMAWKITEDDIDHYGHTNNAAYVKQMENLAWAHSESLGLDIEQYKELDRAMVIKSHHIEYLRPCHLNDVVATATWIEYCDKKLRLNRGFQFIHMQNHETLLTAKTEYICICLSNGKPMKMPQDFIDIYGPQVQESKAAQ